MAKEFTPGQNALTDLTLLLAGSTTNCARATRDTIKIAAELDAAAGLLAALEALAAEPSDDWRDATDDADGHTRTPRQRVLKQARTAIAKAKRADHNE